MTNRTATLVDPLDLPRGLLLPNRIMKAAMREVLVGSDNAPTEQLANLYRRWGSGGYGLLITGNVAVDRIQLGEPGNVVIEDDRDYDPLASWAKAAHDSGTPIFVQLNHPGRQANPLNLGHTPVAPSAAALAMPGAETPRKLTDPEIEDIIDRFARAAKVCGATGFDGVQIHAAHGYLVTQFLSPLTNLRTDKRGGDAKLRMRFLLEIVRRTRNAVSPGFTVSVKLNSTDFQKGGFTEAESRNVVEINGGNYESPAMSGPAAASTRAREAYFLDYAASLKDIVGDVPVAVTGDFCTHSGMNSAVKSGECDLVGITRPSATNPEAAADILADNAAQLTPPEIRYGMRPILSRVANLKQLDGLFNISCNTDQLHRLGRRQEPDLKRGSVKTTLTMVRRNGRVTFGKRRGL